MQDTTDSIRALPLYIDGFNAGRDVGLRDALDCITAERVRLDMTPDFGISGSPAAARVAFADRVLADVASAVAAKFRQVA